MDAHERPSRGLDRPKAGWAAGVILVLVLFRLVLTLDNAAEERAIARRVNELTDPRSASYARCLATGGRWFSYGIPGDETYHTFGYCMPGSLFDRLLASPAASPAATPVATPTAGGPASPTASADP